MSVEWILLKLPVVSGDPTAVDDQDVAIHVAVFGVGEKQRGDRDLVGRARAT